MDFLPIFFKVQARRVLLVGGGDIAQRKARLLLRAGAQIKLVAREINPELRQRLDSAEHELIERAYQTDDMSAVSMVIAASNDNQLNRQIYEQALELNLPVNVVDQPELCTFIFPSIVDRNPLLIAVSSGGRSPVLARLLRARLETFIPAAYGHLANFLGAHRQRVKAVISDSALRMRFWERIINGPVAESVLAGKQAQAQSLLEDALQTDEQAEQQGEVYLVGAGPGDPDLLTFRALRLMQQADVVLYDRLVSEQVLNMTRQDAEKIHVGKQRQQHTMPQQEISALLVSLAQAGKRVLRLKGGDPFIFGRGGEEIEKLAQARIPFQVVPGITAASGCSTYAGIPLTHRDHAQSVVFVTGHMKNGQCELNWQSLVQENQTVVIYMGLISLPLICDELIAHGRNKNTPAALIQQGTMPQQKILTGTLASLPAIVEADEVRAPTLIIVGEVVALHEQLAWR